MAKKLKAYDVHQEEKIPRPGLPLPSGVACTEAKCKGEMLIWQPEVNHPQLPLKRASCAVCGWRGWL